MAASLALGTGVTFLVCCILAAVLLRWRWRKRRGECHCSPGAPQPSHVSGAIPCLRCHPLPMVLPCAHSPTPHPMCHSFSFVPESPLAMFFHLQGRRTWSCWCALPGASTPSPSSTPTLTTEKCRVSRVGIGGHWGARAVLPQHLKAPLPSRQCCLLQTAPAWPGPMHSLPVPVLELMLQAVAPRCLCSGPHLAAWRTCGQSCWRR